MIEPKTTAPRETVSVQSDVRVENKDLYSLPEGKFCKKYLKMEEDNVKNTTSSRCKIFLAADRSSHAIVKALPPLWGPADLVFMQ